MLYACCYSTGTWKITYLFCKRDLFYIHAYSNPCSFFKILFRLQCTQEHVLTIFFFLNLRVKFQPVEKFGDFFREAASLAMHNIHLSATFPLHTFFSLFHGYTEIWIMTSPVQSLQAALLPVITSSGPFLESWNSRAKGFLSHHPALELTSVLWQQALVTCWFAPLCLLGGVLVLFLPFYVFISFTIFTRTAM